MAPVRSAILGSVLAVVVVVTSIIFGASLTALVSHPPLYGWNWNYMLLSGFSGAEDLPAAQTAALLDHDPDVEHWAGVYFEDAVIDGQQVAVLAVRPNAAVVPTPLTGHPLQSADQVVLGPATLAALHKHVGDTVVADTGARRPVHLHIVGTATMPTIGGSGSPDLQMGSGAVMASTLFPADELNTQGSAVPGPNAFLITIRPGVSSSVARHSLQRVDRILNGSQDGPVGGVVSVLRPAEIANYGAVGSTPTVLASILAGGALGALGLTLVSSVRRRRRELALLKALGLTGRQLGPRWRGSPRCRSPSGSRSACRSASPSGDGSGRCSPRASRPCPIPRCPRCPWSSSRSARCASPMSWPPSPDASRPARQRRSCCTRSDQAFHPPEPTGMDLLHPRPGDYIVVADNDARRTSPSY